MHSVASFVANHGLMQLHNTIFGSLFAAEQDISTVMDNFVDTFAPPTDDSDQWFQLLLNILGLAFSVGVVPLFNKCKISHESGPVHGEP